VEDITSLTAEKEKRKKDLAKERLKNKGNNLNRKEHLLSHAKNFIFLLNARTTMKHFGIRALIFRLILLEMVTASLQP